jgi:hypothetical protein
MLKKQPIKRKPSTLVRKPLKKKSGIGLRDSKLTSKVPSKRKKITDQSKLKKQLWELCKKIIRAKYGNTCYTCDAHPLSGGNWHTAHFIASSVCGAYLRYDLRNLRPGCYRCNVSLAGNGAVYYRRMLEREGEEYVAGIFVDKERLTKLTPQFLREKIAEYTLILGNLGITSHYKPDMPDT